MREVLAFLTFLALHAGGRAYGDTHMCGSVECSHLGQLDAARAQTSPPNDGWSVQGEGRVPPGSLNTYGKREMLGGALW